MAARGRSLRGRRAAADPGGRGSLPGPILYTGQDVARFCEVDLKTIHHWADAGKIAHYRTDGRHLRFRRNDLVRFLRAHGYPLHDEITSARPTVFFALPDAEVDDDPARRLAARFIVRRFDHAIAAVSRLVAEGPDVLVCALDDPTWTGLPSLEALKRDPATSYVLTVVVAPAGSGGAETPAAQAVQGHAAVDLALRAEELSRLGPELVKALAL